MNADDLTDHLDAALDHLVAARALGGLAAAPLAEEALDVALGLHEGFQTARRGFVEALVRLRDTGATEEAISELEAAVHHLAGQAAEVGWSLSITARGSPA